MTTQLNARAGEVTHRIVERSRRSRQAYLARIDSAVAKGPARKSLGCANFAHGFAACGANDKEALREGTGANLAIVTAYNDMLSAHQPYERFPGLIRAAARAAGATAQVAGGVPAMCDGVCDKIVPGLLIGALSFGHLPAVFVPAGPMPSGLPNKEKARVRQLFTEGKAGRDELL